MDTHSRVSLRRLSRISHIFHMTLFDVRLGSGSHLSVSVSPEEYKMSGFLGDHCCALCVYGQLSLVQGRRKAMRDSHLKED